MVAPVGCTSQPSSPPVPALFSLLPVLVSRLMFTGLMLPDPGSKTRAEPRERCVIDLPFGLGAQACLMVGNLVAQRWPFGVTPNSFTAIVARSGGVSLPAWQAAHPALACKPRGECAIYGVRDRGQHPGQDLPRSTFRSRYLAHRRGASMFHLTMPDHRRYPGLLSRPRAAEAHRAGWRRPPCRRPPTPR
jgi:hypothetical protein